MSLKYQQQIMYSPKHLCVRHCSHQAQDVDPMLVYCWPTVYDAGPTINQPLVSVSCSTDIALWLYIAIAVSVKETQYLTGGGGGALSDSITTLLVIIFFSPPMSCRVM